MSQKDKPTCKDNMHKYYFKFCGYNYCPLCGKQLGNMPIDDKFFQNEKQWAVAQEKGTVYLNTLSWTRKEAIKKFMSGMDDKFKWERFKRKHGIHCKKVSVIFSNGWE